MCAVATEAPPSQRQGSAASPSGVSGEVKELQHSQNNGASKKKNLKVLIAGGGIGGLVFALAAKNRGFDVSVFEKDLSAIRGEGKYRGPIQIQSNALAALEAVDADMAQEVMENGCITGDRINGLVHGVTGQWYVKFDTYSPAVERGLPITRVISRMKLQQILAKHLGESYVQNGASVVDFEDSGDKVTAILHDGTRVEGDVLIGADGIYSKVRRQLFGQVDPTYSDYTCYTGIADFTPADIDTVGYRVFLGNRQYFVSSDVGGGRMQWYAFHCEAAGGTDPEGKRKERLLSLFGGWCDNVVDLLLATPEEDILRRDIYDRVPIMTWAKGRVALLGDSAHAMQPNLGQGGCMAIEDAYQLALDLDKALEQAGGDKSKVQLDRVLHQYEGERRMRVGAIHGFARMAAIMASTYKGYLGEGLGPLEEPLMKLKIPHPGKVGGYFAMTPTMPTMLAWVLGGNYKNLEGRAPYCSLDSKARPDFSVLLKDDDALARASTAEWLLVPTLSDLTAASTSRVSTCDDGITVATVDGLGSSLRAEASGELTTEKEVTSSSVAAFDLDKGACYVTPLSDEVRISVNGAAVAVKNRRRIQIGDELKVGEQVFKVKQRKPLTERSARPEDLVVA